MSCLVAARAKDYILRSVGAIKSPAVSALRRVLREVWVVVRLGNIRARRRHAVLARAVVVRRRRCPATRQLVAKTEALQAPRTPLIVDLLQEHPAPPRAAPRFG